MWANYAGTRDKSGLMIMTTVKKLKVELSHPAPAEGSRTGKNQ